MILLTMGFVVGIAAGYAVREVISRRRRSLAKRGAIRRKYPN
jgi:hypothetical protein